MFLLIFNNSSFILTLSWWPDFPFIEKIKVLKRPSTCYHTHIYPSTCIFKNFFVFIYFWLRWVFVAARGFSLVVVRKGHFLLQCTGFSFCWLFLLQNTGFSMRGFSTCSLYDPEHGLNSCDIQAWSPRGMWKPLIKDWTCVPCIARWILIHWAMREVQCFCFCLNIHVLIWLFQFLVWHSDFFFFLVVVRGI